jgi:ABC-type Fe3+/spermidine/putrescine transport system ATPase subunit
MDEPLGALDRGLRVTMQEEIKRIHAETGMTMLYVTHDREEALGMSDRVAIMRDGVLLQSGEPREVFEHPCDSFVAHLLGEVNLLPLRDARPDGAGRVRVQLRDRELTIRGSVGESCSSARALLRPWALELATADDELVLEGVVVDSQYVGEKTCVTVEVADLGRVRAHLRPGTQLSRGDAAALRFNEEDLVCLPE